MKNILSISIILLISLSFLAFTSTTTFSESNSIFNNSTNEIPYCNDKGECGLKPGFDIIKKIDGVETKEPASVFIQSMVKFVLTFLALIATIMIIYAGFNLLTSVGEEEKAKKSKSIILYAIIGLVIIFAAGPIIDFVMKILNV